MEDSTTNQSDNPSLIPLGRILGIYVVSFLAGYAIYWEPIIFRMSRDDGGVIAGVEATIPGGTSGFGHAMAFGIASLLVCGVVNAVWTLYRNAKAQYIKQTKNKTEI